MNSMNTMDDMGDDSSEYNKFKKDLIEAQLKKIKN